ncbi:hypothetical protein [Consotaella salsifontis]|uniref:Uncharacterized protein n=1 Tax=Consotaella salsifontis TaxID=1365950 RepID=A0A1T4S1Y6_9HYPH|nr:hypothetical protein [Consotaella salsifontis]SKA22182.1 hypothetical protein SAMN05428963_108181 [Consotaella salsifontis]
MLRFLARLIGLIFLAIAAVFAVGDIARSIAENSARLMSLSDALALVGVAAPPVSGADDAFAESLASLLAVVGPWPASGVFLGLSLLLLLLAGLGRRPPERALS